MLEWNDYPIILSIIRNKSLYRAAQTLDIALSTLMRRVEQLESRAGIPLFRKTEEGYVPTPSGQTLVKKAIEMEKIANAANNALKSEISKMQKKIRISASEVIAPFFVANHLLALKEACPNHDIILTVTTQSPSQTADEFDISLWPSTPSNEDLFGRKITDLKWAYFGAETSEDILCNSLNFNEGSVQFFGRTGAERVNPKTGNLTMGSSTSTSTNSLLTAAALAASGTTTAYLPYILGAGWPGLRSLTPPEDHHIGELWVIYRKTDLDNPHIRSLVNVLVKAAKADTHRFLGA
ncbi:MAG: LysR family transcriptional regulator [Lentilitoribacter sp.]